MDPGEYETNTLLINNVSLVSYKIYEPLVPHSSTYTFYASDVEHTLRNRGLLVYADPLRPVIWCFSLAATDGQPGSPVLDASIVVCGHKLGLVEEGGLEPISLLRNRVVSSNSLGTPNSSSPSGSGLDTALRSVLTPGGTMIPVNPPVDGDVKAGPGPPIDFKGYGSVPAKDIHEYFIAAVLASLSHRFCTRTGAIPLDSKSFVLPSKETASDSEAPQVASASTIASLRVHLTTTGSLLIGMSLSLAPGLHASGDGLNISLPPSGTTIFAAPLGIFGTFQGLADGDQYSVDGSAVPSPETQVTRLRPDLDGRTSQWRNACFKLLEMRGISPATLSTSCWLSIQFLRRKPNDSRADGKCTPVINPQTHIMWPAVLCFRKRTRCLPLNCAIDPGGTNFGDGFDPLNNAKTWFLRKGEREELLAKRKKEREVSASKDAGEADSRLPQNSGFSPLATHRTSNAGAAGGAMYPTPPDAVQNPAGVTPSMDGNTSSPGNPAPAAALVDIDTTMTTSGSLGDSFGDGWDGIEPKREQSFIQGENWELDNDVFAENDITDADFNFFDEQPNAMDVSIPDLPEISSALPNLDSSDHSTVPDTQRPPDFAAIKASNSPAPPVFAKPELKHARSILGESRLRENGKTRSPNVVKRQPSPFGPATIYKKLKASLRPGFATDQTPVKGPVRRGSVFDRLDFDRSFVVVNKKYEYSGRFACRSDTPPENVPRRSGSPPTTDYLRRHGKPRVTLKDLPSNLGTQIAKITGDIEGNNMQSNSVRYEETTSDADEMSLVSDQDDVSDFSDEPSSPTKLNARRRRLVDDSESLAPSIRDIDMIEDFPAYNDMDLSKLPVNNSLDMPSTRYFADLEPVSQRAMYADDDLFMMAAQILTEQAVSGCLKYGPPDSEISSLCFSGPRREVTHDIHSSVQTLQAVLPPCLQAATRCQLRQLLEIQDVPLLTTPSRMQPRPAGGTEQRPSLVQICPPHLELRRHESKLSISPSAVNFWESLGLGPFQGGKDVHSVCVFPSFEGMADNASIFLDRLRSVYESLKLGTFERMPSLASIQNGLVPFDVDKTSSSPASSHGSRIGQQPPLIDDMAKLAAALINSTAVSRNFVIFFVYASDNPSSVVDSCAAFQRLFEIYKRVLNERKKPVQNELVLQLIPLDILATPTSVVVPSPGHYVRLCLETYDRCTLFGGPMPSPSIVLEQPTTTGVNFQLRNPPSANILQENSCMHIAYAQSVDERWITAAWTDNRGFKQMTASYCLGRKGKPLSRCFTDVAHEIWMTTHDLTSIWKVHWRIVITKVGPMDQQEISDWITLAQAEIKSSVSLALLTVDTDPSLQLVPAIPKVPMTAQSAFYSTPASTPQPSTMSPEQGGNPTTPKGALTPATGAATPGADNNVTETDSDASLVDAADTTWGAIASHRLNTSHSLFDPSPALISGYLIKRGGSRAEDPPAVMEVNVIHCEGNCRVHEVLLREMLTTFRGLGTIARARSVTEKEGDVRPWHVAAAEKGVQALYHLM